MSSQQIRMIVKPAVIIGAFVVFYFFIQSPRQSRLRQLQVEFYGAQAQIEQIEKVVAQGHALEEGIRLFQQNRKYIDAKFPAKEEEGLKGLSDIARSFAMEVFSLKSSPKMPFLSQSQEKVEIDGKTCYRVYVSMEMKGNYAQLIQYIMSLKESLPAYISVEKLRVIRDSAGSNKLSIFIDFHLYLLS